MNVFTQYIYHIDELRRESKIKVIDFCSGICSDRQYRRYLSGEQIVTQGNLIMFCEKIGLSPNDFYSSFYRKDAQENSKVTKIYNAIEAFNYSEVDILIKKLRNHKFLNKQSNKFYNFCLIKYNLLTNKITKVVAYDQYSDLVNYPSCLDKNTFDFVDIISIHRIAHLEYESGKDKALQFLYRILFDRKLVYVSSDTSYILPAIYNGVTKILAMKELYVEGLKISSIGIDYCIMITDFHSLSNLYYGKSMMLMKLGRINEALEEAKKCLATAIAKNSEYEIDLFVRLLKKDFKINPMDLFIPGFIK